MSEHKPYFTIPFTKTAKATTVGFATAAVSIAIAGILLLVFFYAKSHLPIKTTIAGISVGNKTPAEAILILEEQLPKPPDHTVILQVDDIKIASSSSELEAQYDFKGATDQLIDIPQNMRTRWRAYTLLSRFFTPQEVELRLTYNSAKLDALLAELSKKVDIADTPASLSLKTSGAPASLSLEKGKQGRAVKTEAAREQLLAQIQEGSYQLNAPVASTGAVLNDDQKEPAIERGEKIVGKSIKFIREGVPFTLDDKTIVSLLALPGGFHEDAIAELLASWEKDVNRPPQEPVFEYDTQTLNVTKFVPPKNGLTLDIPEATKLLKEAVRELERNLGETEEKVTVVEKKLPLAELPPHTTLAQTNDLGITERLGFGESYYAHSIPNRIHNVGVATGRISLHIVKPGEEFSFNKTLGDVSAKTGFRSAYVIQGNQTVLGDGGGVCQVSTTLFRSVLNAGLPVTRRLPHSYRVSYYELDRKPGIDATVYSGETDFRFKNDTGQHILIYGEADSKNLYMFYELYGTSDGRTAEIVDHKTWNFRPAPAPVFIPDPTLPPGKKVQVDWAAAGINASFKNVIKDKDGNVIREEVYNSNYRPWSAKYRQGV